MPTDFHPQAVSLALAKLMAEKNHADAELLVDGCTDEELDRLVRASADLVCSCLAGVADAVHHVVDDETPSDRKLMRATALALAEVCCHVQVNRAWLEGLWEEEEIAHQVVASFDAALAHQLLEHPDDDDGASEL